MKACVQGVAVFLAILIAAAVLWLRREQLCPTQFSEGRESQSVEAREPSSPSRPPPAKRRNVYLDVGGFTGDTLQAFFEQYEANFHPSKFPGTPARPEDFDEVYVFEPNPNNYNGPQSLYKSVAEKGHKYTLLKLAAFDKESNLTFTGGGDGGSLMAQGKQQGITVPTIDFSAWLRQNFNEDDFLMCKIDCEGSEFPIVRRLIADGNLCFCDRLSVEFHGLLINKATNTIVTHGPDLLVDRMAPPAYDIHKDVQCVLWSTHEDVPYYYCTMPRVVKFLREACKSSFPLEKWF
eukprot:TRINITY_DN50792_c0_g1_i1.p1 TRINITY_DN50792_c0_g1~~TRINITY_DN50792_c0_g1_i1.p1  ORF type:complete len:292 (+),score=47.23 TRINITY_DN50792_c0_g1_i1:41-916(+)